MSDRLPYEEQLADRWNDLPVPDEDMAWKDMKERLDKDKDRKTPVWFTGCGMWGLLLLVLIGLGWWLVRPEKWGSKKEISQTVNNKNQKKENNDDLKKETYLNDTIINTTTDKPQKVVETTTHDIANSNADTSGKNVIPRENQAEEIKKNKLPISTSVNQPRKNIKKTIKPGRQEIITGVQKNKKGKVSKDIQQTQTDKANVTTQPAIKNNQSIPNKPGVDDKPGIAVKDSLKDVPNNIIGKDSSLKGTTDSTRKETGETPAKQPKNDSAKKKQIFFGAGLGLQQLIPIDGQKLTPYNSSGRKGSLADYIPSVYFRMYKGDKWFLQAEFRYGAPQYNREFLYNQQIVSDTFGTITTTTSTKLKKTFYHQLPITFNYFITKDWSLGGGFVWNKFTSAISEQDRSFRNNLTQTDSILSKGVIVRSEKSDSNFAKSYFQGVLETQYRWKRFSLGARYAFGLQPYIKFSLPGGTQHQE
ncbi:MAG: hypothetical protein H7Y01_09000, partial [Ferruginibacter sp.]|nr:hypothetical protein [Chitinophagaceae bacterium]